MSTYFTKPNFSALPNYRFVKKWWQPFGFIICTLWAVYQPVSAQIVVEEIVVTAQKREELAQDIGISITTFGKEQIRALGFDEASDVAEMTAGVLFDKASSSSYIVLPSIRGASQNDFQAHQETPNAVYVDEVYISSPATIGFTLFDMERVEILRGPQGTLFGRNATGGLFNYVTSKPTDTFEGYVDVRYGRFDEVKTEGAVSGPLGDNVQGRASVVYHRHDGWWENLAPGGEDAFEKDSLYGRVQLALQPADNMDILLTVNAGKDFNHVEGLYEHRPPTPPNEDGLTGNLPKLSEFWGCPGCDALGQFGLFVTDPDPDPLKAAFQEGENEKEYQSYSAKITWDLDLFTITSITNFQDAEFSYREDCDGTGLDTCQFLASQTLEQWTQELRINGTQENLQWVLGVFYLDREDQNVTDFILPPFELDFLNPFDQDKTSWAVFGQVDYAFTEQLSLTLGGRWTDDEADFRSFVFVNGEQVFEFTEATAGGLDKQSEGNWSGKIALNWTPTQDTLLYASASRGLKTFGFNGHLTPATIETTPFNVEKLNAFELGFKHTFASGRARLNGSAFYYDYKDFQSASYAALSAFVVSNDAEFYGAELELAASPADGLDILLGASYLDTEVKGVTLPSGRVTSRESAKAPEWTLNGLVRKQWPVTGAGPLSGGTFAVQAKFRYTGKHFANVSNAPSTRMPDAIWGDVNVMYTSPDEKWDITALVENVANADIEIYAYENGDPNALGWNLTSYRPPRWWGVQFGYRWN